MVEAPGTCPRLGNGGTFIRAGRSLPSRSTVSGQIRSLAGVRRRRRLDGRGGTAAGLGERGWCDADGDGPMAAADATDIDAIE